MQLFGLAATEECISGHPQYVGALKLMLAFRWRFAALSTVSIGSLPSCVPPEPWESGSLGNKSSLQSWNSHCEEGRYGRKALCIISWDRLQNRSPLEEKLGWWDCGHLVYRFWRPYYFLSKHVRCFTHLCVRLPDSRFFRGNTDGDSKASASFPRPCSSPI